MLLFGVIQKGNVVDGLRETLDTKRVINLPQNLVETRVIANENIKQAQDINDMLIIKGKPHTHIKKARYNSKFCEHTECINKVGSEF